MYISFLKPVFEEYESFKKASDRWSIDSIRRIHSFDKWIASKNNPSTSDLQTYVDEWCTKRDSETCNSCRSRIYPIIDFIEFGNKRNLFFITRPIVPSAQSRTYIPHAFSELELSNFFKACDNLYPEGTENKKNRIRKITVPVFFRLLYSTGMRTTEARFLRRENVNLETGVINIQYSKGHCQHYVVMHDSMRELMKTFDDVMERIMPNREYFFQSKVGGAYTTTWVTHAFSEAWYKSNNTPAVPYALRHHYATSNINKCVRDGVGFHSNFVYLSRTMGHKVLESTKYYYSLVPEFAILIDELTTKTSDFIYPDLNYEG